MSDKKGDKGGKDDDKVVDFKGKAPGVIGDVLVMLMEGGNVALRVNQLSQLQALGVLTAAQYTILGNAPKGVKRIVSGSASIPENLLRKGPDGSGKK